LRKSAQKLHNRVIQATSSNPELQLDVFTNQLEKARAKGDPDSPRLAGAILQLATLLSSLDRVEEELFLREEHLDMCRRNLEPDDIATAQAEMKLARCLVRVKRYEEADPLLSHALRVHSSEVGEDHPETLVAVGLSGAVARRLGRFEEARGHYSRFLEWVESQDSAEPSQVAETAVRLADLLAEWREFDQARELYRKAFELRRTSLGLDSPDTLGSLGSLALTTYLTGDVETATSLAEDLLDRLTNSQGPESRQTVLASKMLARFKGYE
jgi:tetratricopeptide (TPR) repeat protein